jgi:hypothetical protein
MKMFPRSLVLLVFLLFALPDAVSAGSKGTVHVRAYTRRDGTQVAAHDRRAPGTASATMPATSTRYTQPPAPVLRDPSAGSRNYVAPINPASSSNSTAPIIDLPHVRENWSPGRIVSGRYIPGHYAKISLRVAASQLAGSFIQGSSITPSTTLERDANGRIKRSESARHSFMQMTGYPNGRPGSIAIVSLMRSSLRYCKNRTKWSNTHSQSQRSDLGKPRRTTS